MKLIKVVHNESGLVGAVVKTGIDGTEFCFLHNDKSLHNGWSVNRVVASLVEHGYEFGWFITKKSLNRDYTRLEMENV